MTQDNTSAHTAGPWKANINSKALKRTEFGTQHVITVYGDGKEITTLDLSLLDSECEVGCNPQWDEEQKANARLIAAAPELLEACKLAKDHMRLLWENEKLQWARGFAEKLEQLINKAESTSQPL